MLEIATVVRVSNGWLVTFGSGYDSKTEMYTKWPELEKALKKYAFPFPNPEEPRGP